MSKVTKLKTPIYKTWWFWLAVIVVIAVGVGVATDLIRLW